MTIKRGMKIIATNTDYLEGVPNGTIMTVTFSRNAGDVLATIDGGDGFEWYVAAGTYEPYIVKSDDTAPADDTPVLFWDMTPAEKGALLLAHHEGKVIEYVFNGTFFRKQHAGWANDVAYRVKPAEPVVETVTLGGFEWNTTWYFKADSDARRTHRITFNLIDGQPDCASIRMEVLE